VLRPTWPCILHLHGSVHFDMRDDYNAFMGYGGLHDIHWQADLSGQFQQNAEGRSPFSTAEGPDFPTSSIVAGYGKTTQILRRPFRTYYAEIDRLVVACDAVMFLGYGFSDIHLNLAFEKFRDSRRRPAVVVDFADDNAMNANGLEWSDKHQTVSSVLGLLQTHKSSMTSFGHATPNTVARLKAAREFEISNNPDTPLAIWYNGMLAACDNIDKVRTRLR
jgi:SIR2-like domain